MLIDDERLHTLTKYASTKGFKSKIESDHNPLYCKFNLKASRIKSAEDRTCVYNFKNKENQETFFQRTNISVNLRKIFQGEGSLAEKSKLFLTELDRFCSKSFKKIRKTNKPRIDPI
jgi:hypothetical protein